MLLSALRWSFFSELAAKAIQPIVFVVLARLLTPEDFGVMTAALMVIGFSQIVWEAGLGKAVVQRRKNIAEAATAAFWINAVLGVLVAGLLILLSPLIAADIFGDERVHRVLQVMSLVVVLGALCSVPTALLQREMKFKKLFWVRFATVTMPGVASIPLAMAGYGYWALVVGTIVGQSFQLVLLWRSNTWRPAFRVSYQIALEMARFGGWVLFSGFLIWFYAWADSLIVGMYLGTEQVGLYRIGSQMSILVFTILFSPLLPVFYSHFSTMDGDMKKLRLGAETVVRSLIVVSVPIAVLIFAFRMPIEQVVFGDKWDGVGLVIGVMALAHGVSWIVGTNGEVYRAIGRPQLETFVTGTPLIFYLTGYVVSINMGFEEFVWTRFLLAIAAMLFHLVVLSRLLSIQLWPLVSFFLKVGCISVITTWVIDFLLVSQISNIWLSLLLGGSVNAVVLGLIVFLVSKRLLLGPLQDLIRSGK